MGSSAMRLIRAAAVLAVAAAGVAGWTLLRPRADGALRPLAELVPGGAPGVTYYVRPGGNDGAAGTSAAVAWRTVSRAARACLLPGDRLLFGGGHAYAGELRIGPGQAGDPAHPVVIGSYGSGRATLVSAHDGIRITDTGGVTIWDLAIAARRPLARGTAGIQAYSNRSGGMLPGLRIMRSEISGFGSGIAVGAARGGSASVTSR